MKIYVLGNLLINQDSLPLKILPELKKALPQVNFIEIDPSENFEPELNQPLIIIDSVVGIKKITIFADLDQFSRIKFVSLHDYDLLLHLKLLKKIKKLPGKLFIIGLPADINKKPAYFSRAICRLILFLALFKAVLQS